MKAEQHRKVISAITALLQLGGSLAVRKRVALSLAQSAGIKRTAAEKLVETVAGKGRTL